MVQYRQNLIGKHFKSLAQTMVFKIYDITSPKQRALVRAMGELSAMLWITEIHSMSQHTVGTRRLVQRNQLADIDLLAG